MTTESTYDDDIKSLAQALRDRGCALFLGPSCSEATALRSAIGEATNEVPSHRAIACGLVQQLEQDGLWEHGREPCANCAANLYGCVLPEVAWRYEKRHGRDGLVEYILDKLQYGTPKPLHKQLLELPWLVTYTLDYDNLIERASQGTEQTSQPPSEKEPPGLVARWGGNRPPTLRYLIGPVAENAVLTMPDRYELKAELRRLEVERAKPNAERSTPSERAKLWEQFQKDIAKRPFLFMGYGLADAEVLDALFSLRERRFPRSFALAETAMPSVVNFWFEKFNVQTIRAEAGEFLEDLICAFKGWVPPPATRPLCERQPKIWERLKVVLEEREKNGICISGKSEDGKVDRAVSREFDWIPVEVQQECERRNSQGEGVVLALLKIDELGGKVLSHPDRIVNLVTAVAEQVAVGLAKVGRHVSATPEPTPADRSQWLTEVKQRLSTFWNRKYESESNESIRNKLVADAMNLDGSDTENARMTRERRENLLGEAAGDWLKGWLRANADEELRLVLLITGFDRVEADERFLGLVCKHVVKQIYEREGALLIFRRASGPLHWPSRENFFGMSERDQFDLTTGVRGGAAT
jgi:hypothetical protein